jgi:hypothetical protein
MHCDDIKQKDYNKSQSTVNQQICNVNKGETDYKQLHKERKKQYAMWDVIEQLRQNGLTSFMHTHLQSIPVLTLVFVGQG